MTYARRLILDLVALAAVALLPAPSSGQQPEDGTLVVSGTFPVSGVDPNSRGTQILIDFTGAGFRAEIVGFTDGRVDRDLLGFGLPDLRIAAPSSLSLVSSSRARGFNIGMPPTRGFVVFEGQGFKNSDGILFRARGFACLGGNGGTTAPRRVPTACPRGFVRFEVPEARLNLLAR